MNKLPVKQIYLLSIIVFGIITLSVYSTYSIFTLESETSDIVSIETSQSLQILSNSYEYKQITVPKRTYITTDIDVYNNFNYDVCYNVWYKIASLKGIDATKIKVYQKTDESLTTSSTIAGVTNRRISIYIINDNDNDVRINIGLSYEKNEGTCEFNIKNDKSLITSSIKNISNLSDTITNNLNVDNNPEGYLTYKGTKEIIVEVPTEIYVSNAFTYQNEIFTLNNPTTIDLNIISEYSNNEYYACINSDSCRYMYHIKELTSDGNIIKITDYDTLAGYLSGESGIKTIGQNYYYYGDNPNNFIYYNCQNDIDTNTCELWRIIGVFYNERDKTYNTKIIRNDYIDEHSYDNSSNSWNNSEIANYLNNSYTLKNNHKIATYAFDIENITSLNDISNIEERSTNEIVLMNLSDYLNTSICQTTNISEFNTTCQNNNWLSKNDSINEWTMTIKYESAYIDEETKETITPINNMIYSVGNNIELMNSNEILNVRPVIYLQNNTYIIDGDGSISSPYIVR